MKEEYGGTIGPGTWYLDFQRNTKPRRQGMAHAFSFPVCRWFGGKRPPMVPITINTCYPPNWISPRRAFALGRAVREADRGLGQRRAGGDRHLGRPQPLHGRRRDRSPGAQGPDRRPTARSCRTLPRYKLQSATTEILNWVAAAGAMGDTPMELMTYQPGYRSPAGTGCGCAVGRWLPD